ncbi:MAG: hypothetical protein L0Y54_11855 [Sporichthyaceae bacterium]|nr:hypothetical protein [Sporichthyaceae bacterium]
MKSIHRLAIVATIAALCATGLVPTANAARPITLTLFDRTDWEGHHVCPDGAGPCTTGANTAYFTIRIADLKARGFPITIGWQLVNGTAVAGQDFTGPTSGSVTIPAGQVQTFFSVPIVFDGFGEPTETYTARMISSSPAANISDTGLGTIWDGTQIPEDCSMAKSSDDIISMTCTNRPPSQTWGITAICITMFGITFLEGSPVTGNGTSTKDCGPGGAENGMFTVF